MRCCASAWPLKNVAAEVARLTSVLEGPGSTIESMLAGAPTTVPLAPAAAATVGSPDKRNGGSARGSLADRMRALQSRASLAV
jgi:hypothetical protein